MKAESEGVGEKTSKEFGAKFKREEKERGDLESEKKE